MARYEKLSHRHVAILDFMMANPNLKKEVVARHFSMSPSALSMLVNSDAFQEMLQDRQDVMFTEAVVPLRAKMVAAADMAMDRVMEKIAVMDSRESLATADTLLHRLGYAPKTNMPAAGHSAPVQNNNFYIGSDVLAEARNNFGRVQRQGETIDGETVKTAEPAKLDAAPKVHSGGADRVGDTDARGTLVHQQSADEA